MAEAPAASRPRRLTAELSRLTGRSGRAGWRGVLSGGRWLTAEVLAMAPRLPVRDQRRLREQFPGMGPEELADVLIHGAGRAAAVVGAGAGAAMVLPLPSAPVEIAVETLALVGIEIKLVAELHEVYGMRAPGSTSERMLALRLGLGAPAWRGPRARRARRGGGLAAAQAAAAAAHRPRRARRHVARAAAHRRDRRCGAEPDRNPPPRPRRARGSPPAVAVHDELGRLKRRSLPRSPSLLWRPRYGP